MEVSIIPESWKYLRFVKSVEPQSLKGLHFIVCLSVSPQFSDIAKSRSPGSFPDEEVGFPGRFFAFLMFSNPEKV